PAARSARSPRPKYPEPTSNAGHVDAAQRGSCKSMTPDELHEFAERYTEAWCSQDPARVAAHYASDGSLTINDGPPAVGRAAITEAARSFMDAYPDMRVEMDELRLHGAK